MTDTGSTVTIRSERPKATLTAPEDHDPPADRSWFAAAAPGARSPWKGNARVGMK